MTNQDIVIVGLPAWDGDYMKNIVHLTRQLARHNRVLYVEYAFTAKDAWLALRGKKQAPLRRMFDRTTALRTMATEDGNAFHVLTPPCTLPAGKLPEGRLFNAVTRANVRRVRSAIRKAMRTLQMNRPVVINAFNPIYGQALAGAFNEQLLLYFCYDEIRGARWNRKHGTEAEEAFIRRADVVVTTSHELHRNRQAVHPACHLIKNGVDFKLFHQAACLDDTHARPAPCTIGYIGSLDDRVDYDLLERVCEALLQHPFHFIGRITSEATVAKLRTLPNVTFVGPQPHTALPSYLRDLDVCLLPFAQTEFTRNMYPLKINEYFAAGKPVVSTRFASLPEFEQDLCLADDAPAFVDAIVKAAASDTLAKRRTRIDKAYLNDWSFKGQQLEATITAALHHKQAAA